MAGTNVPIDPLNPAENTPVFPGIAHEAELIGSLKQQLLTATPDRKIVIERLLKHFAVDLVKEPQPMETDGSAQPAAPAVPASSSVDLSNRVRKPDSFDGSSANNAGHFVHALRTYLALMQSVSHAQKLQIAESFLKKAALQSYLSVCKVRTQSSAPPLTLDDLFKLIIERFDKDLIIALPQKFLDLVSRMPPWRTMSKRLRQWMHNLLKVI